MILLMTPPMVRQLKITEAGILHIKSNGQFKGLSEARLVSRQLRVVLHLYTMQLRRQHGTILWSGN